MKVEECKYFNEVIVFYLRSQPENVVVKSVN